MNIFYLIVPAIFLIVVLIVVIGRNTGKQSGAGNKNSDILPDQGHIGGDDQYLCHSGIHDVSHDNGSDNSGWSSDSQGSGFGGDLGGGGGE